MLPIHALRVTVVDARAYNRWSTLARQVMSTRLTVVSITAKSNQISSQFMLAKASTVVTDKMFT